MEVYVIEEVNNVHVLMVTLAKYVNIVSPIISTPQLKKNLNLSSPVRCHVIVRFQSMSLV